MPAVGNLHGGVAKVSELLAAGVGFGSTDNHHAANQQGRGQDNSLETLHG